MCRQNILCCIRSHWMTMNQVTQPDLSHLQFCITAKAHQIHGWIDFVLNGLQPFYIVENEVFRRGMRFEPVSYKTFFRYFSFLTKIVEKKIADSLPDKFTLVFDGWTAQQTHYGAIFLPFHLSQHMVTRNSFCHSRILKTSTNSDLMHIWLTSNTFWAILVVLFAMLSLSTPAHFYDPIKLSVQKSNSGATIYAVIGGTHSAPCMSSETVNVAV